MDIKIDEKKYIETLEKLVNATGVSCNEKNLGISNTIFNELKAINEDTYIDEVGNVVAIVGSGKKKIMIDAHLDEVGFIVTKKNSDGVFLGNVGIINPKLVDGSNVFCPAKNITGKLRATNSNLAFESNNDDSIEEGDIITFKRHFDFNDETRIISATALDNRASCAALIELVRGVEVSDDITLIITFTTKQELDLSSLPNFAEKYKPDFGIAMDAAYAQPVDFDSDEVSIPVLGHGCAIQHFGYRFVVPEQIIKYFMDLAQKNKISVQNEIPPANTGKTSVNHLLGKNILSGVINIPARYQHTELSEMSLDDALGAIKLLSSVLSSSFVIS